MAGGRPADAVGREPPPLVSLTYDGNRGDSQPSRWRPAGGLDCPHHLPESANIVSAWQPCDEPIHRTAAGPPHNHTKGFSACRSSSMSSKLSRAIPHTLVEDDYGPGDDVRAPGDSIAPWLPAGCPRATSRTDSRPESHTHTRRSGHDPVAAHSGQYKGSYRPRHYVKCTNIVRVPHSEFPVTV